ncbi:exodeoxyribonuclease VII large subunit [Cellulosilyticum sp. I15G10I2]|uniref:exodeoxyribonuclease VII large subunit n=1 Tax=Cellulosilyticum sp. I15G10I2 TaxID=1892843 RepID=UPI00085CC5C6|nr:exodeoxyribonuclease VII large subunit [Cellulosilyticum sp. I15G10I2]
MKRKIVSVSEINNYVNRLIEDDYMLGDVWLAGEVSNCKYHHSGHIYFTLKDERASLGAVMFSRDASKLNFKLIEGTKIYARVKITIYEKTGTYQAYVYDIEKQGKGLLYERFEELKAKLSKEGLFETKYKKNIPLFPKRIGVITSVTGAAIKDIIQVAKRRNPSVSIYIYPAHVQGELAVKEITAAIDQANRDKLAEVIILGRGGGSIEDLWAFNEELVARAIFASEIPIVSAVGHEVDFTIADFVSDKRAATPSAAAEIVIPSKSEIEEMIKRCTNALSYMTLQNIKYSKEKLNYLIERPVFKVKDRFYKDKMQEVDLLIQALNNRYKYILTKAFNDYELAIGQLEKLSPFTTLKRGYSLITKVNNGIIKSIHDIEPEEVLQITVTDGTFKAKVYNEES